MLTQKIMMQIYVLHYQRKSIQATAESLGPSISTVKRHVWEMNTVSRHSIRDDRFGISVELISRCARKLRNNSGSSVYVPTRLEVATMDSNILKPIIDCWLHESPREIVPTDEQVQHVKRILRRRADWIKCSLTIKACEDFLDA